MFGRALNSFDIVTILEIGSNFSHGPFCPGLKEQTSVAFGSYLCCGVNIFGGELVSEELVSVTLVG